jgi:Rgg/GadR/MutR family transcriptional activator
MLDFKDLGEHYKKVRGSRGYTIGDVCGDNLDKAQISRFENGKQMLLLDGFMHAIDGLNMTASEFFLTVGNFEAGNLHKFGEKLQAYVVAQDISGLKGMIVPKPRTKEKKIFNVLVKCAIRDLSGKDLLTNEECQFIDKYLTDIEEWTVFDVNVLGMCMEALDIDMVYHLGLEMLAKDKFYKNLPYNAWMVKRTIVNLYVNMILHGRFVYANEYEQKLKSLLKAGDTEERIAVCIFKKISEYRQEKNSDLLSEIKRDIQTLKNLDAAPLAGKIEILLINYS